MHTHTHTHTHKTTTEDDDAAALHHTCILNFSFYVCLVSVEVLTAFLVGINGLRKKLWYKNKMGRGVVERDV